MVRLDFNVEESRRIADEIQLLNEKQWLKEAIRKVRAQRNSLQIERLHLESLKSKLLCKNTSTSEASQTTEELPAVNLMQPNPFIINLDSLMVNDEDLCNREELNLSVSELQRIKTVLDMELEDEYEDEDSEDDDYDIDINMFMNGDHNSIDK